MHHHTKPMLLCIGACTGLLSTFSTHALESSNSLPAPPEGVIASTYNATNDSIAEYYDIRSVSGYAGNERFRRYDLITNILPKTPLKPAIQSARYRLLVNCELMEFANVEVRIYNDYYGSGLVSKKQVFNRWEEIAPYSQAMQIAQHACAIPIRELAPELPE